MAEQLIYRQLALVMRDIGAVGKNQVNKSQGFKFRGIDDVYNACHDAMAEHGVVCFPEILDVVYREQFTTKGGSTGWHQILKIRYRFCAEDGSYHDAIVFGEAMDTGDKCTNKCMAIGHKYALLQVLCIQTEETDDPDKDSHQVAPPPVQRQPLPQVSPTDPAVIERKNTIVDSIIKVADAGFDFVKATGKSSAQLIDLVRMTGNPAALDKLEKILFDAENDVK